MALQGYPPWEATAPTSWGVLVNKIVHLADDTYPECVIMGDVCRAHGRLLVGMRESQCSNRVFPVVPHVDAEASRLYINAGHLVWRPERELLHARRDVFFCTYRTDELTRFYHADERCVIFYHQAILSAVLAM